MVDIKTGDSFNTAINCYDQDHGSITDKDKEDDAHNEHDTVPDLPPITGQLPTSGWELKVNQGRKTANRGAPPSPSTPPPESLDMLLQLLHHLDILLQIQTPNLWLLPFRLNPIALGELT